MIGTCQYPPVFAAGAGHPFTDEFQDWIREHMMARIQIDPNKDEGTRTFSKPADAAERRARLVPQIVEMFTQGMSRGAIARQLLISHRTVSRIIEDEGARVGPARVLEPLVAPARFKGRICGGFYQDRIDERALWVEMAFERGYTTAAISEALGISGSAVGRIKARES